MTKDHTEDTFVQVRVTNKDIYSMLKKQGMVQDEILEQAKLTNGRVTKLEGTTDIHTKKLHGVDKKLSYYAGGIAALAAVITFLINIFT